MAPCKLLCQVPTWNLEFWATGFCPSKELPGHIESSWSWKFCDSRVCLEATRLVESARRQKRLWCFDVLKHFAEISWRSFSYLAISMVCSVFFKTFWRLKENCCAFKFLTDSGLGLDGMSFWFVAMFSPCRSLSNCWKFMAIPPNNWCSRWGCGTWPQQKQKTGCFVGCFFG